MISIYDKSKTANISNKEINDLIKNIQNDKIKHLLFSWKLYHQQQVTVILSHNKLLIAIYLQPKLD